jgi:Tfp pilus assembly protein PilN
VNQVNLLPPELRQRQAVRRTTSFVVAGGLVVIALVGVFFFLQSQRLADVQDELAAQGARNADLQTTIAELQSFADLEAQLDAKRQLVTTLFLNEVSWSSALLDVSRVIPDASYLLNMTGQVQGTGTAADPTAPPVLGGLIGNMTFSGVAQETETIASWLVRLEQVDGWVNAWVTSAQENAPFSRIYTFASGLDLTLEAATDRGQGSVTP